MTKNQNDKTQNDKTQNEKTQNEKTNLIQKINNLPEVIVDLIKEYIPKNVLAFTNRENYNLYN